VFCSILGTGRAAMETAAKAEVLETLEKSA
jgi:hypothetical protein